MEKQTKIVSQADDAVEAIEQDRKTWAMPTLKKLSVSDLTAGGFTPAPFEGPIYSSS